MRPTARHFLWRIFPVLLAVAFASAFGANAKAQQEAPKAASDARDRAAAILNAGVAAAGGTALGKIESAEFTVRKPQASPLYGATETELQFWLAYPAQMRLEEWAIQPWIKGGYAGSGSGGPITPMQTDEKRVFVSAEVYDGAEGWVKTSQGTTDLTLDDGARFRIDLVGGLGLMRRAAEGKLEAAFVGEEELHGRKALAVRVSTLSLPKLYFDPATHLLVGARFRHATTEGTFDTLELWGDYRRVSFKSAGKQEAIQFPFAWTTYREGKKDVEEKVKKVKLNTRPSPKTFARPK